MTQVTTLLATRVLATTALRGPITHNDGSAELLVCLVQLLGGPGHAVGEPLLALGEVGVAPEAARDLDQSEAEEERPSDERKRVGRTDGQLHDGVPAHLNATHGQVQMTGVKAVTRAIGCHLPLLFPSDAPIASFTIMSLHTTTELILLFNPRTGMNYRHQSTALMPVEQMARAHEPFVAVGGLLSATDQSPP